MAKKKESENAVAVVQQKSIGQITRDAYVDFGYYYNTHRHLAGLDGLKISYRRLIYSAMQFPKGKLAPSTTLINYVANFHPHGLTSMNEMSASLYKSGIFAGEGSFGYTSICGVKNPPANERYTHTALSDLYWELMGDLIKEVPYSESPIGPLEPNYLPLPLPLCLYMKTLSSGMGVGISMIYPNFSAWSLYQAYLNNNPNLLEPNVDLILDKSNSELDKLWTTGEGRVIYVYKISRQKSPDGKTDGILFETKDGTEIFTPSLKEFNKLEAEGKVFIEDLTDIDGAKLFIGRIPGARGITIDDIEKIAQKCCFKAIKFALNVTNGSSAFRIPLYNWIDYTYKNYISLITNVNKKRIDKCKFDILVQESIPVVAGFINSKPDATDEEIVKATKVPQEVVDIIMSKPISYIRKNKDTSDRIKVLKDRLVNLQKFNAVKFTEEIIKKL